MLVSTKFSKIDGLFNILKSTLTNSENNDDNIQELSKEIAEESRKFDVLYLSFLKKYHLYYKGKEFDIELKRLDALLDNKIKLLLRLVNKEQVIVLQNKRDAIEKDKRFATSKIQKLNIVVGSLSLVFFVILLCMGLDADHPFSLLLVGLSLPLLTSQVEHRIIYFCGSVLAYILIMYSLINLPTPEYIKISDGFKVSDNIPKTLGNKASNELQVFYNNYFNQK